MDMFDSKIAQCVGLWLAEGDNKTDCEITFTNNCWELVQIFHSTLKRLYNLNNKDIRVYTYSKNGSRIHKPIKNARLKFYTDIRARKPYFIWRVYSKEITADWKSKVKEFSLKRKYYSNILQGFCAGEGHVKSTTHNSRSISLSQLHPVDVIDRALAYFKIDYKFDRVRRKGYMIQGRENWDILNKIKIADLHPRKKDKFHKTYNEFKQYHYARGYLKKEVSRRLCKPKSAVELSRELKRSQARICDVLMELKKEKKAKNFRAYSRDYWIKNNENTIIISKIKKKYLNLLNKGLNRTYRIAKTLKVDQKSSLRRLNELKKLKLVKRDKNKKWYPVNNKMVKILGIDEAGSLV